MCCTESRPAWLLVSLGAVRPVAALQLLYKQDLTYTLALANASDGPFVQVASQTCGVCTMNMIGAAEFASDNTDNYGRRETPNKAAAQVPTARYVPSTRRCWRLPSRRTSRWMPS